MIESTQSNFRPMLNKVPQITLGFWVIKIMSTTVGETCADYLAVSVGWGHIITGAVMSAILIGILILQLISRRYIPWIYWLTVVLISIVGTQITDLLTDKFEVSLYTSTTIFSLALVAVFAFWYRIEKTLSVDTIITRRRELFYWGAILCTFALGTAAGDLSTEALGWGFKLGVIVFCALIALTGTAYRFGLNSVLAFWITYILTRPLGASLGDLLSQSQEYGGVGLGAVKTSILFLSIILFIVLILSVNQNRSEENP